MEGLLALITAFPTVVFATLAVVCLAYWVLVLVGIADVDIAGGHDHGLEAVAGAVKGFVGAAKGGGGIVGEALAALGLSRVPVTITLTTFSLTGFLCSAVTASVLTDVLPSMLQAFISFAVAAGAGLGAASLSARALARLFVDGPVEAGGEALVGKTCRVTIAVDDRGGQARVDEVIVAVRAQGITIAAGEEAVIVERGADGVFLLEPLRAHLPSEHDTFALLEALAPTAVPATDASAAVDVIALAASRKETKT